MSTSQQYDDAIRSCKDIFTKKMKDYGTAWRVLRTSSITDQIFIKAQRIRSIEEKGTQRVNEDISSEFIGMVNYSIIGLIQLHLADSSQLDLEPEKTVQLYNRFAQEAKQLMEDKNHDYNEAWRQMRVSSFTDLILMKIMRIRQIEDNQGNTLISEGIDANYFDILNYSVFALIKLAEAGN
ncbi:MAG: DUF1599 domain-containing protein [Bacteroidia bacterium]|nr:DUF1599 domain-containing protein [Bacteroidia bacterium]